MSEMIEENLNSETFGDKPEPTISPIITPIMPSAIKTEPLTNKTTTIQLNSSLNIIAKKPVTINSSIFTIPQQTESATSVSGINQTPSTFSPPNINTNKITLIPLNNLTSIKTTSGTTVPNPPKTFLSSNTKKVFINTSQTTNLINPVTAIFNQSPSGNDKTLNTLTLSKPTNTGTKILTLNSNSPANSSSIIQPISVQLNSPNNNNNSTSSNSNTNTNKIQYVKIVNTGNNTQQLQVHQQTIPNNMTKAIKITTISANNNNSNTTSNISNSPQNTNTVSFP